MKSFSQALRCVAGLAVLTACGGENEPGTNGLGTAAAGSAATTTAQTSSGMTTAGAAKAGSGAPATGAAGAPAKSGTATANAPATGAATAGAAGSGAANTPATTASAAGGPASAAAGSSASTGAAGAAAGAAGGGAVAADSSAVGKPPLLPTVMTTDGPGPFNGVVKVKNTPPGGWLIYPMEIGREGVKHPLFLFGPGGGTTPDTYEQMGMHWDRYGSYGFVIYVLPMSTGNGADMKAGLDWLIKQNDDMASPLYQKLDTTKVTAAGHSQGSVTVFDFMPDDRVTTTINISGGSFDGMGPSHLKSDAMFLCGPDGGADVAFPQCETDFTNTKVPTYYTNIQGSSHLTSGRLGWASIIAWMLWHMAGQEEQWKKEFLEPTGQFQMGIYKSQIKNW